MTITFTWWHLGPAICVLGALLYLLSPRGGCGWFGKEPSDGEFIGGLIVAVGICYLFFGGIARLLP